MIDEPIYETHSMTSHNHVQVQVQEPEQVQEQEPEQVQVQEQEREPAAKRSRPGRIERLKRQRDQLAAQNAAMRTALAKITQLLLDTSREVRFQ